MSHPVRPNDAKRKLYEEQNKPIIRYVNDPDFVKPNKEDAKKVMFDLPDPTDPLLSDEDQEPIELSKEQKEWLKEREKLLKACLTGILNGPCPDYMKPFLSNDEEWRLEMVSLVLKKYNQPL